MTRAALRYAAPQPAKPMSVGFDAATPTPGFYRYRLVRGGHPVGVRIFYGAPRDPVTGEEMDRSWRWQATANNAPIDLERVWPMCGREPIDEAEHDYLAARQAWAAQHAPDAPEADPRRPIDLLSCALPI